MGILRLFDLQWKPLRLIFKLGISFVCLGAEMGSGCAEAGLPPGFVYLRNVAPSIAQDIRYAISRNFTGKPVPGYGAAECLLRRDTADALRRAQEQALSLGLTLKVYDCYRPVQAVRAFMAWAATPDDGRTKSYYPHLTKSALVPAYIATQSRHSTGTAVDLTLAPLSRNPQPATFGGGDCTAPANMRDADGSLDMGTAFDCFDPKANTASTLASFEQRKSRMMLKTIMEGAGFQNYSGEWWHYSYSGGQDRRRSDFPIGPRPSP